MALPVPVITVDGPSGTGKGTLAMALMRWLGWHLLDSGALYRLVSVAAADAAVAGDDFRGLAKIAADLAAEFEVVDDTVRALLDGKDMTARIRSEACGVAASKIATLAAVRAALLDRQRAFCKPPGLVADGRDMGTNVFPQAELKIYLTASPEVRAERRYKQLKHKGNNVNLARLLVDIRDRDERDQSRQVSPLRPAPDAIILDTTDLDAFEVEQQVRHMARDRGLAP